jgi:hypothetical protein
VGTGSKPCPTVSIILSRELRLDQLTDGTPQAPALQDDHPENEHFFQRQYLNLKL